MIMNHLYELEAEIDMIITNAGIKKRKSLSRDLLSKYQEKYKDNPSLVESLSESRINDCLTALAHNKVPYKAMDSFVEELNSMDHHLIKNIPSLITLYESCSNEGIYKAYKKFAPQTATLADIYPRYAEHAFITITKDYVGDMHQRITGRTVQESIRDSQQKKSIQEKALDNAMSIFGDGKASKPALQTQKMTV